MSDHPPVATERSTPQTKALQKILQAPWLLAAILLVGFLIINISIQKNFFSSYSISLNITTFLPLMLIAVGQTFVIFGGSIDLSLGAIVSLVNVVVVVLVTALGSGLDAIAIGIGAGIGVGMLCGGLNGFLIATFRLPPIVTTFATGIVYGGLALMVLPQAGGSLPSTYYLTYGTGFFGLTLPIYILAALLFGVVFVSRTKFHKHILAVGGNRQSAFQSGLPVRRIIFTSHTIAGLMAALAALCILGVAGAGDPLMGQAITLGSVSAVVLGGTALAGGWGSLLGAILGAAILGLINNIIFFANINYVYQSIVQGSIILVALAAGVLASRRHK